MTITPNNASAPGRFLRAAAPHEKVRAQSGRRIGGTRAHGTNERAPDDFARSDLDYDSNAEERVQVFTSHRCTREAASVARRFPSTLLLRGCPEPDSSRKR